MGERKLPPLWSLEGGKKKKSIVRIPDEFYFQYFSLPYVHSYFKVGRIRSSCYCRKRERKLERKRVVQ